MLLAAWGRHFELADSDTAASAWILCRFMAKLDGHVVFREDGHRRDALGLVTKLEEMLGATPTARSFVARARALVEHNAR